MIGVYRANIGDCYRMASHMRPADLAESLAFTGRPMLDVLRDSYGISPLCKVICIGADPVVMYGVAPSPPGDRRGSVWLRATVDIGKVSRWLLKASEGLLQEMHDLYPAGLHAYADTRNTVHLRWLEATGFTLGSTIGIGGATFIHATR